MSTLKQVSYSTLTTEIYNILNSGSLTTITLYSDNLGTIMTDNNGKNIENEIISKIDYTHPQLDSDGNITVKGFTVITFNDNSFFKFIDTEDTVWFALNPVQVTSRFFTNVSPIKTSSSVETTNV
jgi:hypothetical protein